jgi:hypothetical protein
MADRAFYFNFTVGICVPTDVLFCQFDSCIAFDTFDEFHNGFFYSSLYSITASIIAHRMMTTKTAILRMLTDMDTFAISQILMAITALLAIHVNTIIKAMRLKIMDIKKNFCVNVLMSFILLFLFFCGD